jgi:hypothetical protein
MPENNNRNDTEEAKAAAQESGEENAWVKFERGQVSRRAALKKIGITSAMAVFAMFSVDDLARMVGQKMEQRAGDSKIAEQIAREFQQAGIVLAGSPSNCTPNYNCTGCGGSQITGVCCSGSSNPTSCCQKSYGSPSGNYNIAACRQCCANAWGDTFSSPYVDCCNTCGNYA